MIELTGSIYGVSTRQSTHAAVTSVTIQGGGWGYQNEPRGAAQNEPQTLSKRINTPLPPAGTGPGGARKHPHRRRRRRAAANKAATNQPTPATVGLVG
nr:MAG TPA: hypothetical protein [Caudoviricetes sp.]